MKRIVILAALAAACSGKPSENTTAKAAPAPKAASLAEAPAAESATVASVAVAAAPKPTAATNFRSIGELSYVKSLTPEVVNGTVVAHPEEWRASFYTYVTGGHQSGWCTSTLVGDRVLLTAAHCVGNGMTATLTLNEAPYYADCTRSDHYEEDSSGLGNSDDYALCVVDKTLPGITPEVINTEPSRLQKGHYIRLAGFGCIHSDASGGNDRQYRTGDAAIAGLPSGKSNYIKVVGVTTICMGDSGGAAYLIGPGKTRFQVSVNSQVEDFGDADHHALGNGSYLSSTSTPAALAFFRGWTAKHKLSICGLDNKAGPPCRQS